MKKLFLILVVFSLSFIGCPGPHDSLDNNSPLLGTWTLSTWFSLEFDNSKNFVMIDIPPPGQQPWTARGTYSYTDDTVTFHNVRYELNYERWNGYTFIMDYQIVTEMNNQILYLDRGNHERGGPLVKARLTKQ